MRRSAGTNRAFAGGQVSRQALNRRGFDFGTTSDNPHPLTRDDGGTRQTGSVRSDHAISREYNDPRRSAGFQNPQADYGPGNTGSGHIDDRRLTGRQYPAGSGYTKQPDRPVQASDARALRGSASETWMGQWYGYPSKRQGG
jgi:hypothetical protein